jgi:hypothetical protein
MLTAGLMIDFALHTQGTTRLTLCIGRYALKFARGQRGYIANCGKQEGLEESSERHRERRDDQARWTVFLDLSQYTRNYAFMMVLSVPPIEVTAPY